MKVTLYALPGSVCHQCRYTKKKLADLGIVYEEIRLDQNRDALDHVHSLGYQSAPVVEVEMGDGATWTWSGNRPSKLEQLAKLICT
jgi:glutaredoxin-like protein NrdH